MSEQRYLGKRSMAGVAGKRAKVVLVKKDAVDQAGTSLGALPEKTREEFSLRAAVQRLSEPIKAALGKGYSYEEVAELLAEQGIAISASTLKNYAPSRTRQSRSDDSTATKERATRKTKAATPQPEVPTEQVTGQADSESKLQDKIVPPAQTETPKAKASKATQPKTRTSAAKTAPSAKTKTAAKAKSSSTKQTATARTVKKPAATLNRAKTTKKK